MRGQISVEYILILSFTFMLLIPGIFFFHSYSEKSTAGVSAGQFNKLGQSILAMAIQSAAQGEGSWLTLEANIPASVEDINVSANGQELIISYQTSAGTTRAVFFSDITLAADTQSPPPVGVDGSIYNSDVHAGRASFRFTTGNGVVGIKEFY